VERDGVAVARFLGQAEHALADDVALDLIGRSSSIGPVGDNM
jgi:hypothetical protein